MASSETKVFGSIHEDPNFAVICSFISRYGTLLGLPDISFDALEKWIEDQRYMNDSVKDLLLKLLKRWKSSVNEDRLHQYLIKFCHSYSQVDAFEVESCGFQRCKTATKLRIIKTLLEQQFDSNTKFKEKINEVPVCDLRCLPIGRDMTGKAYWFLSDKEMNIRIYREEQDDVQNETWHIVVNDRSQLANLITTLEELKGKLDEKSRSATPSTVISESNKSEADCCQLFSIPATSESSPHATDDTVKVKANGLAKPDFLLSSVKDEPPETPISSTDATPEAEHEKLHLMEEKEDFVAIKSLSNETKTSVEVKLEAEDNNEFASSIKAENKDTSDMSKVVEDKIDAKEEDECKEAESLIISPISPRNDKQNDENAEKSTETVEVSSSETACDSGEITSSYVEGVSTLANSLSDFSDGKFSTVAASSTACEKDPEFSTKSDATDSNLTEQQTIDNVAVAPAVAEEMDKRADPSSSSADSKSSSCAPIDLSGVNREQGQKAESGDIVEKPSPDAKARVSVKRKRCEPIQRLSSTEADSARSESDLSESASELKMRSSGEEPPSKRKRDKALRTVAERDRRSGRVKGQKRSQTPDNKKKGLVDEKSGVPVESRDEPQSEDRSVQQATTKENSDAGEIRGSSDGNEAKLSANTHEILEIKCPDGGKVTQREQFEAQQTKLDDAKVLSTATNDEAALPEAETEEAGVKPEDDQSKRPACRPGRKGRKHGRSSRRKGRREEKENAAEKKSDTKTGTSERGRKKRGLKPSTNQEGEVDYEPNSKLVRPETTDESKLESKATSKDSTCVSEDDVPLIELRRSARANKGQRKFEPLTVPEPKKRRKNAELLEEKNRRKAELEEKRLKKEAELAALAAKNKKKRRGKNESDDDFVPGKGPARKAKGRSRGRKRAGAGGGGGSEEESEELEEELFEPESEEESLRFSASSSEEELESDGSVYEPKGRNAKRAAALKENAKRAAEVHDQLCSKCGRSDQPEWLLLCDHCEAAYHTACLRPPLLAIPEGDWFCPPCEHASLIIKLQEQLIEYDKKAKQNVRLIQRKERLAFVGISLSNILPVQQERRSLSKFPDLLDDEEGATECEQDDEETEEDDEDTEEEEEDDRPARSRNARQKHQHQTKRDRVYQRRRKQRQRSPSERSFSEEATEDEDEEEYEDGWTLGRRSRRQRKEISYKFEEFDELINEAIEDDVKDAKGAGNFGRGKDMSNITGIRDSDNDDHGPHGKRKKRRHLTKLDSNDEEPDDDDSEEYQISEDEASSASAEEEEDTIDADEESDDWNVSRQPIWGRMRSKKGSRRSKRSHKRSSVYDNDFVVDEYDSEDDRPLPRRRRAATQRRINYQEDSDETDASQGSRPPARKKPAHRSGIYSSGSENGNSGAEKKQRRKTRGKSDDSEYVPSADEERPGRHGSSSTATKKTGNHKRIGSETDEYSGGETVSRKKGRMNNYIIESSEEEGEDEVENSTMHRDDQPGDGNRTEGSLSDAESRTSEEGGLSAQDKQSAKESNVLSLPSKPETAKMLNGHCSASAVNGNTESHNNHNFSIANLLKNSDKRPAALPRVAEFEASDLLQTSREDSLTDVLDLVDYVTQGDPA